MGETASRAFELELRSYPRPPLRLMGWLSFASPVVNRLRRQAADSQKRAYPGDWVFEFVEGDGIEFDYGLDFFESAVCKFLHAHGADELVPHLYAVDFPQSRASGTGLVRTGTMTDRAEICDFRFKMTGPSRMTCLRRD